MGLAGNAQFIECDWILDLPLVPIRKFFTVRRGERRGWDPMFYPSVEHDIDDEYIRPVVKSPTEIAGYITTASSSAFSCTRSIEELEELGHNGTLQWINHYRNQFNNTGRPLPEVLAKSGIEWYQMPSNRLGGYGNAYQLWKKAIHSSTQSGCLRQSTPHSIHQNG